MKNKYTGLKRDQLICRLEDSELRLNIILDTISDFFVLYDTEMRVINANKASLRFCQTNIREVRGKYCYEMWNHSQASFCDDCPTQRALKNNKTYIETRNLKERIFELRSVPVSDSTGKLSGVAEFARDITEQIYAEQLQNQANIILKESPVMLFKWSNPEVWVVDYVSENAGNIIGYTAMELISEKAGFLSFIHPSDVERVQDEVFNFSTIKGNNSFTLSNYRLKTKHGEFIWVQCSVKVIYNSDNTINHYIGVVQNISEKIIAEQKLKESVDRFYAIFQGSRQAMIIVDKQGIVSDVNPAVVRITGYSKMKLNGKPVNDLLQTIVHPNYHKQAKALIKEIIRGQKPATTELRVHEKILEFNSFINILDFGYVIGFDDVTEIRANKLKLDEYYRNLEQSVLERTQELNLKNESLEESQKALTFLLEDVNDTRIELQAAVLKIQDVNKELESFSYSVSHDLKAPLRAIDGFSQILLEDYFDLLDEEGKRYLNLVRENTQKMGQLIQDLLDYSRAGRLKLNKETVDLNQLVNDIIHELSEQEKQRKLEFITDNLPVLETDRMLVRQVFTNLISNAIKFTNKQEKALITINYNGEGNNFEFAIKDNGVGFNMKYAGKLFNVFQRLHTPDQFEGTGVGLAIVKRIINRFNGKVWVKAEPEKGAHFYFTIPKPLNHNN